MLALEEFEGLLKKERRSAETISAHLSAVRRFSLFLHAQGMPADIDKAQPADIAAFVDEMSAQGESATGLLWSLHNYYRCSGSKPLQDYATRRRLAAMDVEKRRRSAPRLSELEGASVETVSALRARGVETTKDLLKQAASQSERVRLARDLAVPLATIDELVAFADLSRITDIKGKRGRLLLDAGIRSVAELRAWDPEDLRRHLTAVARGSGRRPATAVEAKYWVQQAKRLPDVLTSD